MEYRHEIAAAEADELLALCAKSEVLAMEVRRLADTGLCIFEIDQTAFKAANGRVVTYKLPEGYQRILAAGRAMNLQSEVLPLVAHPPLPITTATQGA